MKSLELRHLAITADPEMFQNLCNHVANGGSAIEYCKAKQVSYADVMRAIRAKPELKTKYDAAVVDRQEWTTERWLQELSNLSSYSVKDMLNPDGSFKQVSELSDEILAAIKEIDAANKTVKFTDKLKALELLGKKLGLFVEKREVQGVLRLEDLIYDPRKPDPTEIT